MGVMQYFGVNEWKSILMASLFMFFIAGLSLLWVVFLWIFLIISVLMSGVAFYQIFFKKSRDKESVSELADYMKGMFK